MKRSRNFRFERLEPRTLLAGHGDFNGDGFDDLAIGVPDEDVGSIENAGAVQIIYGGSKGLKTSGNQFWTQDSSGVNGVVAPNERFGSSLAVGDFNGDRRDDLAIGVDHDTVSSVPGAGAVNVLYGSSSGLRAASDQLWTQNSPGINDTAEAFEGFGFSLAAGDFNNDGRDDLAIGVIEESVASATNCGAVNVIYGSASGLTSSNDQFWHQDSPGINDKAEFFDKFGFTLTTGDFNGDGRDDLAIGVRGEMIGGAPSAGAVNVIYGSSGGLTASVDQFWFQGGAGLPEVAEESDAFGTALAAGDFNDDGFDELAIGVLGEDNSTGGVQLLLGTATKLAASSNFFNENTLGFLAGTNFRFGASLATGDFDNDGFEDLAVGTPGYRAGVQTSAGAVYAVYGSPAGLLGAGAINPQRWTQGSGLQSTPSSVRLFGTAVAAGDFDGDGRSDLAVGVPRQSFSGVGFVGAVQVIYGFLVGLFDVDDQLWDQSQLSASDGNDNLDNFGTVLA